ncbi:hypothetical protein EAE99_009392 [Botrytis elliptica]|nr:hypothetical protein EAE99_009392 [Botrytis elliptica]
MNTTSLASYPILSCPITTLLLTLFFIFLLYIPRFLYLYLRTRIFRFWKRNMAKRISHFEAFDLARAGQVEGVGGTQGKMVRDGNVRGDKKRKSKRRWDWDLEKGDAEAKEEEENEWATKGEMAKGWDFEGEEMRQGRRLGVAEESRWLHCAGRDGDDNREDGMRFGSEDGGEDEREEWCEIQMDKELDG